MNQEQTNITTGKQIRHLRTQLGMTQEELAGELNVTRQALSNWERDVNEPDLNWPDTQHSGAAYPACLAAVKAAHGGK